jgi:4-amino-4-deoxy-L-arabinose transferase-like glycosyltransferase
MNMLNNRASLNPNRMPMDCRILAGIFALALLIRLLAILPVQQPGYMDAAYSYDIALNLARGQGFVEPFLWNYLDNPSGLPHPSHLYWMPLPTVLAWIGMTLFGQTYQAAQVLFAALSAMLPLVSYWVAVRTTGSRRHGWLAGLLTLFSGFYVLYWGHTDNFTPFALAGSLSLVAAWQAGRAREEQLGAARPGFVPRLGHFVPPTRGFAARARGSWGLGVGGWALGAGVLVGLAHLSRADGPLLLIAIGVVWSTSLVSNPQSPTKERRLAIRDFLLVILGYTLVMLPWFVRNWMVVGTPLPTVGSKTMWLTTYDDLFSYGRELSLQTYLAWGWNNILRSKLDALWLNTQTVLAVFCMIFLAPLVPIGWWRLRRHRLYQLAAGYGALLFLAMTLVFTFPGPRGGLFHSGGALLPFVFTSALVGLDTVVEWAAGRRRGWDAHVAKQVFGTGVVGLALLVTGFLYYRGVIVRTRGRGEDAGYSHLVEWLETEGQAGTVVMIGDPPGYWYHGGGPSIVVPNEPVETVLSVADRYGARYLALDRNRPAPLASLYEGPVPHPRLSLVETLSGELRVYHIAPPQGVVMSGRGGSSQRTR